MQYPDTTAGPASIDWYGRRYYLNRRRSGGYYYPAQKLPQEEKRLGLHQAIWAHEHGSIPTGHVIHHKDGNSLNNDPANLEAKPKGRHQAEHMAEAYENPQYRSVVTAQLAGMAQPRAAEWHASEVGRAWHRANAEAMWSVEGRERMAREITCEVCGAKVTTYQSGRTCGRSACYNRRARQNGRYRIEAVCAWCGASFRTNKHRPASTCSPACAANRRWHGTREATS